MENLVLGFVCVGFFILFGVFIFFDIKKIKKEKEEIKNKMKCIKRPLSRLIR